MVIGKALHQLTHADGGTVSCSPPTVRTLQRMVFGHLQTVFAIFRKINNGIIAATVYQNQQDAITQA